MNQSTPQNQQSNADHAAFVNAQAQRNMAQENRTNAAQHAQEAQQLREQAITQNETQYKVTSTFRDSQENNKLYQVGDTYQSTDISRTQELLAAHVIAEEIPQVQMQTSDPAMKERQAARQAEAQKVQQVRSQMAQQNNQRANQATAQSHAASKAQEQSAQTANQATANEAAAQQNQAKVKKVASKQGNE